MAYKWQSQDAAQSVWCESLHLFFFNVFILERGREGEREGEKHQYMVASHTSPTGDLACNPGMCPKLGIEPMTLWFAGQHSIH